MFRDKIFLDQQKMSSLYLGLDVFCQLEAEVPKVFMYNIYYCTAPFRKPKKNIFLLISYYLISGGANSTGPRDESLFLQRFGYFYYISVHTEYRMTTLEELPNHSYYFSPL